MKKKKFLKIIFFLAIFSITCIKTIKWLDGVNLELDDDTVEMLLESSGNIDNQNRIINKLVNIIKNVDIIDPVTIMINTYKTEEKNETEVVKVSNTKEEVKEEKKEPIVYIYNTHQTESFYSTKEININYSIMDASYYLQKRLKKYGIESYVEKASIQDVLNTNNWNYASSYRVSRMYLEKRKKDNENLEYFIDLHRDSVSKKISTVEINGVKYAKILFILGLENKSYKNNEKTLNKMEQWLEKNYNGISRGIYRKEGKGVNGVYNQDFSENCILIEVGGEENTYEEVENSIDVIAEMINYYIGETSEKKNN